MTQTTKLALIFLIHFSFDLFFSKLKKSSKTPHRSDSWNFQIISNENFSKFYYITVYDIFLIFIFFYYDKSQKELEYLIF